MRGRLFAIFFVWLFVWTTDAQGLLPGAFRNDLRRAAAVPRLSLSGQFIIYNQPDAFLPALTLKASEKTNYVEVEPSMLAVSCERIKSALLAELGVKDQWRGRINVSLHRATSLDEPVVIGNSQDGVNWTYYMALPDTVEQSRLVAAVVNVLLLEMADRNSMRAAEIPTWLAEGLTRQLMCESPVPLVVSRPEPGQHGIITAMVELNGVKRDPLTMAHDELRARPPLMLDELSWPQNGHLEGEAGESYRCSAQLFVHELTQLKDGRACLRAMIPELARHMNWQMAFLDAFREHFGSQLELEKWWALQLAGFTGRDLTQAWPRAESWRKLDEIVRPMVEVRTAMDELPLRTEVTLQSIIAQWNFAQQAGVINEKIQQLFVLRTRVSQDLILLVDDYREALDGYMKRRIKESASKQAKLRPDRLDSIAKDTLLQLDLLDARREQLRPTPKMIQSVTASVHPNP